MLRFGPKASRAGLQLIIALTLASIAPAQTAKKPLQTPPTPIQISGVTPNATTAPLYGQIEITVDLHATFTNPFDPDQISVEAQVTPPSGQTYSVPGFYYQPFSRDLAGAGETLKQAGQPGWRVRIALTEKGVNKVVITARDSTGTAQSQVVAIAGEDPETNGFVKVSERDFHYFESSDGSPFFPIGASMVAKSGLIDLETWIPALSHAGGNAARIMLGPENAPFALTTKASGAARIDLGNAWRLDQAMELMDKSNVHPILCLDNFNELRERDFDPRWPMNPYNRDNGGPLNTDKEFWTSGAADKLYNAKLRYVVARYGAYSNLIGWELWREVDLVHFYDADTVRAWFDRHTQYMRSLDPYGHLISVSFADPIGERSIDHLPGIDFVQSHVYNVPDLVPAVTLDQYRKAGYGKPQIATEVAADRASDHSKQDTNGLQVHDPAWASIVSGSAGMAMPWWWDSYVFPKRMYNRFGALAAFVKGIDWPGQNFRTTSPVFTYQQVPADPIYKDLVIENGPVSSDNTEYNLPRHVRIWPNSVQYGLPVSGILHGQKRHPSKFNPVTFTMDIKRATQFDLMIGDVSGAGGAYIQVKLDGEIVMGLDLADPNDLADEDTITKYHGTYSIHIPAGHHEPVVADVGNDWVMANYRFRDIFVRKNPPLIGYCLAGDTMAIAWVRDADRSWDRIENQKRSAATCPPTTMTLQNLIAGAWRAELWDTWTGKVIKTVKVTVGSDGIGVVNLPEVSSDLAIKLLKNPAPIRQVKAKPAKGSKP